MAEVDRLRSAAERLTARQFEALNIEQVSALAQAYGQSGLMYEPTDRERVWKAIQARKGKSR